MDKMKQITVRLPERLHRRAKARAAETGISLESFVAAGMEHGLESKNYRGDSTIRVPTDRDYADLVRTLAFRRAESWQRDELKSGFWADLSDLFELPTKDDAYAFCRELGLDPDDGARLRPLNEVVGPLPADEGELRAGAVTIAWPRIQPPDETCFVRGCSTRATRWTPSRKDCRDILVAACDVESHGGRTEEAAALMDAEGDHPCVGTFKTDSRLTVRLPETLHRLAKSQAATDGVSLERFIAVSIEDRLRWNLIAELDDVGPGDIVRDPRGMELLPAGPPIPFEAYCPAPTRPVDLVGWQVRR